MTKLFKLETKEEFQIMEEEIRKLENLTELNEELFKEIQEYEENGFYSPLSEDAFYTVPIGERWYVKYDVTYHISTLLLNYYLNGHEEIYEQLMKTIYACISKNYMGHSYDAHYVRIKTLIKLYENGLPKLFKNEKYLSIVFEKMINEYRLRLSSGNTQEGFDDLYDLIIKLLEIVDKDLLFVYGTLMENEVNSHYLDECNKIGNAEIEGYDIVDAGGYPGIIPTEGIVAGELYSINESIKKGIDRLEENQYTYERQFVFIEDLPYLAHFYQYKMNFDREYYPCIRKDNRWINTSNYVWYACYGSNLLEERFNEYLLRTTSKQIPIESKPITLNYVMYFAKNSTRWNNKGVAFLDANTKGETLGWKYLITKEQFNEIQKMEGSWYSNKLFIETDEYGIDTYTFTSKTKYETVKPAENYLNVIKKGLKEKYNLENKEINQYLQARIDNN